MNHTVIDPKIIAKIKKLNRQIESLRELRMMGLLENDFDLTKLEIELQTLINEIK